MKTNIKLIDQILEQAQPLIDSLTERQLELLKKELEENNKKLLENKMTNPLKYSLCEPKEYKEGMFNFALSCFREGLTFDLIKSLSKYSISTDRIVGDVKFTKTSTNGGYLGLAIECIIERDGIEYLYFTEVICAGGYNIQRFHLRYITKTKLPKVDNSWFKVLVKNHKTNKEINSFQNRIDSYEAYLIRVQNSTKEEIALEEFKKIIKTATELPSYIKQEDIDRYYDERVKRLNEEIKNCKQAIEKLNKKLL